MQFDDFFFFKIRENYSKSKQTLQFDEKFQVLEIDFFFVKIHILFLQTSGGEREIPRTTLELLNQLDGFDSRGDVKVIMTTNRTDSLDDKGGYETEYEEDYEYNFD